MLETLKNAWKIADLRQKILYTLLIVLIFRLGSVIPLPYMDPTAIQSMVNANGSLFGYLNVLSGGSFGQATIFALSISPYITSSIVIQLLSIAIPYLERLSKEGAEGRKKLNKITRYTTVGLAAFQSIAYYFMFRNMHAVAYRDGFQGVFAALVIILSLTAGSCLVVWLGECINDKGIGNGISLLLFAGIVSRGPAAVAKMFTYLQWGFDGATQYLFFVPLTVVIFVAMIAFIIIMTNAERRIPVQYAKRMVGRKMYGGQSTHIPIKVNMSGVMPVIFASSLLGIPGTIKSFVDPNAERWVGKFLGLFNYNTWLYAALYFVLIIAFNYFYVALQYNPLEMSNNLRKNNGTVPGYRPGKPTTDYISKVINKVTLLGALFLAVLAIAPIILGSVMQMNISLGGTSMIIVVGVALDTVRQLESQMMMRHYKGFLE